MQLYIFFFFNDTATTEIYTLSLHDALPISCANELSTRHRLRRPDLAPEPLVHAHGAALVDHRRRFEHRHLRRSEEHTSELQSHLNLVCRLLLEKKKKITHGDPPKLRQYTSR